MEGTGESTLRAKYLDWCSARLAERFLDLSPEEIYDLARPEAADLPEPTQRAGPEIAPSHGSPEASPAAPSGRALPPLPRPTDAGYRPLVQRVTEALLRRSSLPTFEQWAEAYAESPERFEAELLGFWKDVATEDVEGGGVEGGAADGS